MARHTPDLWIAAKHPDGSVQLGGYHPADKSCTELLEYRERGGWFTGIAPTPREAFAIVDSKMAEWQNAIPHRGCKVGRVRLKCFTLR